MEKRPEDEADIVQCLWHALPAHPVVGKSEREYVLFVHTLHTHSRNTAIVSCEVHFVVLCCMHARTHALTQHRHCIY